MKRREFQAVVRCENVGGALRAAIFHQREQLRDRRWDSASHIQARILSDWALVNGHLPLGYGLKNDR